MIKGFVGFSKIKTKEEYEKLVADAKSDDHGLFLPTHPLRKFNEQTGKDELVGYFSVGHPAMLICFAWLSTKDITARESFHLINDVEGLVSSNQNLKDPVICFPVPKSSPFHSIMESMGYSVGGEYTFFYKKV